MNVDFLDFTSPIFFDSELSMTSGYCGKKSQHLLKKAEHIYSDSSGHSMEYSYEFDDEGYVKKIFYVTKEWENGGAPSTWSYTITITYV